MINEKLQQRKKWTEKCLVKSKINNVLSRILTAGYREPRGNGGGISFVKNRSQKSHFCILTDSLCKTGHKNISLTFSLFFPLNIRGLLKFVSTLGFINGSIFLHSVFKKEDCDVAKVSFRDINDTAWAVYGEEGCMFSLCVCDWTDVCGYVYSLGFLACVRVSESALIHIYHFVTISFHPE